MEGGSAVWREWREGRVGLGRGEDRGDAAHEGWDQVGPGSVMSSCPGDGRDETYQPASVSMLAILPIHTATIRLSLASGSPLPTTSSRTSLVLALTSGPATVDERFLHHRSIPALTCTAACSLTSTGS